MAGLLSEQTRAEIQAAVGRYPEKRSASIAALRAAQYQLGWLSPEVVAEVGAELDLDPNALYQLVTFYDMFYDQPVGKYVLGVCNNLSCYLNGADSLLNHLRESLGIEPDQTTPDGVFTLRTVECLAACGNAPAMMVNEDYHERLTHEAVDRLLDDLRGKAGLPYLDEAMRQAATATAKARATAEAEAALRREAALHRADVLAERPEELKD